MKKVKRSVCFFMLYHKRPELTRMSMWHMAKVIRKFNDAGHSAQGIVVGCGKCEPKTKAYADKLGLEHVEKRNHPLSEKFSFAYTQALLKETDYVCKLDSNNFNSDQYWEKCIDKLFLEKVVSFGTNRFTIMSSSKKSEKTCVFKTRHKMHLCNSGQFYLNWSLSQAVNFRSVYPPKLKCNFDGKINEALSNKWSDTVIETISSEPDDCFDVKDGTDIHSYESYMKKSPSTYPHYKDRGELVEIYEELKLLDLGYFSPSCDKIVEPGADLSELERI
jgi:hypothetical protein